MKVTFSHEELPEIARQFWETYANERVFAMIGEMGVGKTTFIKALCSAKGVDEATASPTFSIINEYRYTDARQREKIIYHLDLYRLKSLEEAIEAGVEDCLYHPDAICFVEWPEVVAANMPYDAVYVFMTVTADQKRKLVTGSVDPGRFAPSLQ